MRLMHKFLFPLVTALAALSTPSLSSAQEPLFDQVKILVGLPPGGGVDLTARRIAEGLRGVYARNIVVENKPGASARLVVEEIQRGPADGLTLLVQPQPVMTLNPHVDPKNTRFKYEDLTPVASLSMIHHALVVGPRVPDSVRTMKDFVAWAKANPGQASYGSPGGNSPQQFLMEAAMHRYGFTLTHAPYKGAVPGIRDMLGGHIAAMLSPLGDYLPLMSTERVRIIATTGEQRSRFTPDVPTFKEQGFEGMELFEPFGLWAKAGTPDPILDRLHKAVNNTLSQPDIIEFFLKAGMEAHPMSRQAFIKAARDSYDGWEERVRITGFKPE